MVDVYKVIDVEDRRHHDSPHWQVLMEREDGWRIAHIFPDHIFEARAGEYGIPHDDIETLIDIVLHEAHIPDPLRPQNRKTDPAALQGMVVNVDEPVWLYNAPSTKHAREAHLLRIKHLKENVHRVETAPGDPLDAIRDSYEPSAEAVALMAEHVRKTRFAKDMHARRKVGLHSSGKRTRQSSPLQEFFEQRRSR